MNRIYVCNMGGYLKMSNCPEKIRDEMKCPKCGSKLVYSWNWLDCTACQWCCKAFTREPIEQKEALDLLPDGPEYMDYEY